MNEKNSLELIKEIEDSLDENIKLLELRNEKQIINLNLIKNMINELVRDLFENFEIDICEESFQKKTSISSKIKSFFSKKENDKKEDFINNINQIQIEKIDKNIEISFSREKEENQIDQIPEKLENKEKSIKKEKIKPYNVYLSKSAKTKPIQELIKNTVVPFETINPKIEEPKKIKKITNKKSFEKKSFTKKKIIKKNDSSDEEKIMDKKSFVTKILEKSKSENFEELLNKSDSHCEKDINDKKSPEKKENNYNFEENDKKLEIFHKSPEKKNKNEEKIISHSFKSAEKIINDTSNKKKKFLNYYYFFDEKKKIDE